MADVTYAQVVNQMSALVNSWQIYIDQQIQLDNGLATYTTSTPAGQPGPGYYPVTMPNGLTTWQPCRARIQADASAFTILNLTGANGYTATTAHSGKVVAVYNNGGTSCNITFPTGLGIGFNAIYIWMGSHTSQTFNAASGVTLIQDQGLTKARTRYSMVTAIAVAANTIDLSGSMIP